MILMQQCSLLALHGARVHRDGQRRGGTSAEESSLFFYICSGDCPTLLLPQLVPAWLGRREEHEHGGVAGQNFQLWCAWLCRFYQCLQLEDPFD